MALFHFDTSDASVTSAPINETNNGIFNTRDSLGGLIKITYSDVVVWSGTTSAKTAVLADGSFATVPVIAEVNVIGSTGFTFEYMYYLSDSRVLVGDVFTVISYPTAGNSNTYYILSVTIMRKGLSDTYTVNISLNHWVNQDSNGIIGIVIKDFSYSNSVKHDKWLHVALVLENDCAFRFFVNGIKQVEILEEDWNTDPSNLSAAFNYLVQSNVTCKSTIKCDRTSQTATEGYFDELRFSGVARYHSNFTPPDAPFTIASAAAQTALLEAAADNDGSATLNAVGTTASEITGSYEVKFAGNFVSATSANSGDTAKATAYPLMLKMDQSNDPLHLEIQYSKSSDYSSVTQLINTKTTAGDRQYVRGDGGSSFETCPATGFPYEVFGGSPIMVNMTKLGTLNGFYYLRYRWLSNTSDTSVSDWYRTVYPAYTDVGF